MYRRPSLSTPRTRLPTRRPQLFQDCMRVHRNPVVYRVSVVSTANYHSAGKGNWRQADGCGHDDLVKCRIHTHTDRCRLAAGLGGAIPLRYTISRQETQVLQYCMLQTVNFPPLHVNSRCAGPALLSICARAREMSKYA